MSKKTCDYPNLTFENNSHKIMLTNNLKMWQKEAKLLTEFEMITDHGLLKLQNFEEHSVTLLMGFLVVPNVKNTKTLANE